MVYQVVSASLQKVKKIIKNDKMKNKSHLIQIFLCRLYIYIYKLGRDVGI